MSRQPVRELMPAGSSRSLATGLRILNHLRDNGRPMSLSELSTYAKTGRPSILRLLQTLEQLGYVARDDQKRYRIDAAWPPVEAQDTLGALRRLAYPVCRELHNTCGETVSLAWLFDDHIRVIHVLESPQQIRMANYQGRILQPYASSLGKAITAFQEHSLVEKLLDVYGIYPLTANTLVDRHAIRAEFSLVRTRGYAEDREETVAGGHCIGVPVHTADGKVMSSLSVSTPSFRMSPALQERLPSILKAAAQQISTALDEVSKLPQRG